MNQQYCNGMIHVIKEGDTLYQLSRKYRVPLALILRANPYVDVYNLQIGQEICIPVARPFPGMMVPPFRPPHRPMPSGRPERAGGPERPDMPERPERPDVPERPDMPEYPQEQEPGMDMEDEDRNDADYQPEGMCSMSERNDDRENDPGEKGDARSEGSEYICGSSQSVGDILREQDMTIFDLLEHNSPDAFILAEGTKLYLAKKV